MTEELSLRVRHKQMTAAEWLQSPAILLKGEIGFETDTGFAKFGDGVSRFADLKYLTGPVGPKGDTGQRGADGQSVTVRSIQKTGKTTRVTFSDGKFIDIQDGADGAVTFASLTPQQKEEIRGPQGVPGRDGAKGEPGQNGRDGLQGPPGRDGAPGQKGADGQSVTVQVLTQSQYDGLSTKQSNVLYLITR